MREILFKAKRLDNGEWVEGDLFHNDNTNYPMTLIGSLILSRNKYTDEIDIDGYGLIEVDPEAVCQYTGLKDRNGKKIFEEDIIKVKFRDGRIGSLEKEYNYVVKYYGWQASFEFEGHDELLGYPCLVQQNQHTFEVIGNIHDNLEMLEVEGRCPRLKEYKPAEDDCK